MKRWFVLTGFCCVVAALAVAQARLPQGECTPRPEGPGWTDLLDKEHAPEWKETKGNAGLFEIEDGMIHVTGSKSQGLKYFGYMKEKFGDFQLHIEFKLTANANSGVMIRALPEDPPYQGMEVQVYDDPGKPPTKESCGSLFDVATPMFNVTRPTGEWNSFDITFKGQHLEVVQNGWKVLDVDLSKMTLPIGKFDTPYATLPLDGYLFVQDHHQELWYRNILIKKL
ncbi:MAG: DUF1080 domain-containing protein [Candidatus Hydrogenedentes bacterium]|nr:DUF1080 domain-containing protein [Candidatus Hydrogenedentota bacterium]